MGKQNKKPEEPDDGQIPPDALTEGKKRRRRLPTQAKLLLDDSLPANEHHPLAKSAPEFRDASRLRLIAGILARMARSALGRTG
jgi:hypothetical protein